MYGFPPWFFAKRIISVLARAQNAGMDGAPWLPPLTRTASLNGLTPPAVMMIRRWDLRAWRAQLVKNSGMPRLRKEISVITSSKESNASEQSKRVSHSGFWWKFESSTARRRMSIAAEVLPPLMDPN